jgi:hypothetical protein
MEGLPDFLKDSSFVLPLIIRLSYSEKSLQIARNLSTTCLPPLNRNHTCLARKQSRKPLYRPHQPSILLRLPPSPANADSMTEKIVWRPMAAIPTTAGPTGTLNSCGAGVEYKMPLAHVLGNGALLGISRVLVSASQDNLRTRCLPCRTSLKCLRRHLDSRNLIQTTRYLPYSLWLQWACRI